MPGGLEAVAARRGKRRQHGQAERAADLGGGVDQPRGQSGVGPGGARHRERHQRGEADSHAGAEQDQDRQDVDDVVAVDRGAREHARPAATRARPGKSSRRAPKRMISGSE